MKKIFRLQLIASDDRFTAIDEIRESIRHYRGFIVNHHMFSDLQMNLYVEMKERRLLNLYHTLNKKYRVSGFELDKYDPHSYETCKVFFLVSFITGAGKLRAEIPKVPG